MVIIDMYFTTPVDTTMPKLTLPTYKVVEGIVWHLIYRPNFIKSHMKPNLPPVIPALGFGTPINRVGPNAEPTDPPLVDVALPGESIIEGNGI